MSIRSVMAQGRPLRVIGFDDSPFRRGDAKVQVSGVVCSGTRFEGMVCGEAEPDGFDATDVISSLLSGSKYQSQVHAVLLDGIAVGGLNIIDLPALADSLGLPCITFTRRRPDLEAMQLAIARLPDAERRLSLLARAGELHESPPFFYQCEGISAEEALAVLQGSTDTGHVPEPLRLAHLINSAFVDGESRGRA